MVDSPPGIMSASQAASWGGVRISRKCQVVVCEEEVEAEAERRSWMCSLKAPWRARTPIVIVMGRGVGSDCVMAIGLSTIIAQSRH